MSVEWCFQYDNPKHISKYIYDFVKRKKDTGLEWPSQSSDLNSIKYLGEKLDRRIRTRNYSDKDALNEALQMNGRKFR